MSFKGKRWKTLHTGISTDIVATLLANRQVATEDAAVFFEGRYPEHGYDPHLMEDMHKAVDRIREAIAKKERIVVFGDYDVDGTTGTAVLVKGIEACGGIVSYRIPHRLEDGYGLKTYFIDELAAKQVTLIVTVDNGISAYHEVAHANTLGIDVIVTDHHEAPKQLPDAVAVLNPRLPGCAYPNKHLSGSMVGYKLIEALTAVCLPEEKRTSLLHTLLDIATIGLVADCMPLTGENRSIVRTGLELLRTTTHAGLRELFVQSDIVPEHITSGTIGFQIGPRINASGRMESAYNALHLLLKDGDQARQKASILERLNMDRREMVRAGVEEAIALVGTTPVDHLIMIASPNWNPGINGLIASGLLERFARPVIVLSEKEGMLTASARSIDGCNIIELISKFSSLLGHFGGHPQAAGFSITKENYKEFRKALLTEANRTLRPEQLKHTLRIDCPLTIEQLTKATYQSLQQFEPYGIGNPRPCFTLPRVTNYRTEKLGKHHDHLKLHITTPTGTIEAIAFSMGDAMSALRHSPPIALAFELDENTWNGNSKIQLLVKDITLLT